MNEENIAQDQEILDAPTEPTAEELIAAEREKYLRLAAEYDNFRKRSRSERDAVFGDAKISTIKEFLPVYDSVELALKHECSDTAFKQGVELIMRQLETVFEKLGVEKIPAEPNTPFDPALHEAIAHIDDANLSANVVAEELRKGFKIGDKVIRFTMVKAAN